MAMRGNGPFAIQQPRLRICFVSLHYAPDEDHNDIPGYLTRTPISRVLPQQLASLGHEVDVVHLWSHDETFVERGVRFYFVSESMLSRAISMGWGKLGSGDPVYYQPAWRAIRLIRSLRPDVIQFHGSALNLNLHLLLRAIGRSGPPVILHYHGGYPAQNRFMRWVQRFNFSRASRHCFSTLDHAQPFIAEGILDRTERVIELMETSSTFGPEARAAARQTTAMFGDPVFLSVGRLHPIKDPMTMIRGFERVLEKWTDAHLYLHYTSTELLSEITEYLRERPSLDSHVHLRGRAMFEQMESIYNSADFLLQASVREFSGCAVLEAMACGVIPVVTDIPSFRAMTSGGQHGVLYPVGDFEALAREVLDISRDSLARRSHAIRAHFEHSLSFRYMADRLESMYHEVLAEQTTAVPAGLVAR